MILEAKLIAKTSIPGINITTYKGRGRPSATDETPIQDLREPDMYFTAGQIFRGKMMLTCKGTPQRSRMKVNAIVNKLATAEMETPWGLSKAISTKQLNDFNSRMVRIAESKMAYNDFMETGKIRYIPQKITSFFPVKDLSTFNPQSTIDQTIVEVSQE